MSAQGTMERGRVFPQSPARLLLFSQGYQAGACAEERGALEGNDGAVVRALAPTNVTRVQISASTTYVGVEFVDGSLPCSDSKTARNVIVG